MALSSSGIREIFCTEPSKCFRSLTITASQRSRSFNARTRYGLITVNSPDRFDFTYKFWNVGSIDWDTPQMLEIVAVGAIAITFELRIPSFWTLARKVSQSKRWVRSTSNIRSGRVFATRSSESIGKIPWSHNEPLNVSYVPRSTAKSLDVEIA